MRTAPSERELDSQVKLVEVMVKGNYIAMVDKHTTVKKRYEIAVLVPEKWTMSDIKRLTPQALIDSKEFTGFRALSTFEPAPKGKATGKTAKLRELYTDRQIEKFAKHRRNAKEDKAAEVKARRGSAGVAKDDSEYDPETGLPPLAK